MQLSMGGEWRSTSASNKIVCPAKLVLVSHITRFLPSFTFFAQFYSIGDQLFAAD